ncbi:hypothetical protein EYF80_028182 [Liparis tanakae]|uniref:Uncharacterized protein n=1 Tax=Liparis tanakae TaxID=230148 RepID=A0A4Z2H7U2_9TELE|nr:hypothetical protein EYF80_028182 [Liparis tanakae]
MKRLFAALDTSWIMESVAGGSRDQSMQFKLHTQNQGHTHRKVMVYSTLSKYPTQKRTHKDSPSPTHPLTHTDKHTLSLWLRMSPH